MLQDLGASGISPARNPRLDERLENGLIEPRLRPEEATQLRICTATRLALLRLVPAALLCCALLRPGCLCTSLLLLLLPSRELNVRLIA